MRVQVYSTACVAFCFRFRLFFFLALNVQPATSAGMSLLLLA